MRARPSRPAVRAATALAACGLTAAVAGCGTGTLDTDEMESTIAAQFRAQGVPLRGVTCEDGAKAEKGERVSCSGLNPAGTRLIIEGTVTAVRDGDARFAAKAVRGVARGPVVAAQARRLLEARVGQKAAGMTCPAEVPIPTTPTVRCVLATTQGPRYAATVRIDAQNRMRVQLAQRPLASG